VPELRRLQYFVAVAQERNFTRAAEHLHVAQSALSRQVRLLEQELGVELLRRTTHEFELTEAGRFLLDRGPALLSCADRLWREVRGFGTGARGTVEFAYGASASYETAPRLLAEIAERYPEIELSTRVGSVHGIVSAIEQRSVDVGLVRCPPDAPWLEIRSLRRERQGLLVRSDHRLAGGAVIPVSELAGETLLLHPRDANPAHYDAVLALCANHGVRPTVMHRNLSFDLAHTPIARGQAVAIVGESAQTGLPSELRWVPLSPSAELEIALLARRDGRTAATDRVLDAAAEIAASLGWTTATGADEPPAGHAATL
jgi:DNA-binding transcriptional LysR family regulator